MYQPARLVWARTMERLYIGIVFMPMPIGLQWRIVGRLSFYGRVPIVKKGFNYSIKVLNVILNVLNTMFFVIYVYIERI